MTIAADNKNDFILSEISEKLNEDIKALASLLSARTTNSVESVERITKKIVGVAQVRDEWDKAVLNCMTVRESVVDTVENVRKLSQNCKAQAGYNNHEQAGRDLATDHIQNVFKCLY